MLAADTIKEGVNVYLDIPKLQLMVARPTKDANGVDMLSKPMLVEVYNIKSTNDALDFFEYIEAHKNRFLSVNIR